MTKKELLDKLALQFKSVDEPVLANQSVKFNGGKWYQVNVLEVIDDGAIYRNIHFYVIDEGKMTEMAYFKKDQADETLWKKQA